MVVKKKKKKKFIGSTGKACYARLYSYSRLKREGTFDSLHRALTRVVLTDLCGLAMLRTGSPLSVRR